MAWPKARENWFTPGRTGASTPPGKRCRPAGGRSKRRMSTATWKTPRHTSLQAAGAASRQDHRRPNAGRARLLDHRQGPWPDQRHQRPKAASAPLSGAAVAVSSGTSAMGIEFRFENRQGSPMIVGTGGPCATSDLGLYRVEAVPSSLMAREKAEDPYSWKRRDSRSSAKRRQACRSTTSERIHGPRHPGDAARRRRKPEHPGSQEELPADAMRCPQPCPVRAGHLRLVQGQLEILPQRCQAASGFTCRATCGSRDSAGPSRPGHVAHSRDARRDRLKRAEPAAPRPPDRPSRRTCPPRTPRPGCHSAVRNNWCCARCRCRDRAA